MFEDLSAAQGRETPPSAEPIVVSGAENGGIMIRQADDRGYVVVPPEQAESLIAAIRRHLQK